MAQAGVSSHFQNTYTHGISLSGVSTFNSSNTHMDINAESSAATYPIGTKLIYGDRTYRYSKSGAAIGKGLVVMTATANGNGIVGTGATSVEMSDVALGATSIVSASITCAVDEWAGGYLVIEDSGTVAQEGGAYLIKSNTVASGATSTITLYDAIEIDAHDSFECHIVKNLYNGVITTAHPLTGVCVGVTPIAISAGNKYFWLQTSGPAGIHHYDISGVSGLASAFEGNDLTLSLDIKGSLSQSRVGDMMFLNNTGDTVLVGHITGFMGVGLNATTDVTVDEQDCMAVAGGANIPVGPLMALADANDKCSVVLITGFLP
jgi:hypothetical protein